MHAAERIAIRARALREAAGTLTGHAAEGADEGPRDVLTDVLAVFGSDAGLQWGDLAARLASRFPARWDGATGDAISAECRAAGVPSRQRPRQPAGRPRAAAATTSRPRQVPGEPPPAGRRRPSRLTCADTGQPSQPSQPHPPLTCGGTAGGPGRSWDGPRTPWGC